MEWEREEDERVKEFEETKMMDVIHLLFLIFKDFPNSYELP